MKPSQRKPVKHKKTSHNKISEQSSSTFPETNFLEATNGRSGFQKKLQLIKVNTPPNINHLFCYGAVCYGLCFFVLQQQRFE